jgi:hypothetical protein
MAYFARVSAIPQNSSGVGARGYHIYQRRKQVITVWGSVKVRPGQYFYWAYTTQHKTFPCASVEAAVRKAKLLVHRTADGGYSRLPPRVRIHRTATSAFSTPRRDCTGAAGPIHALVRLSDRTRSRQTVPRRETPALGRPGSHPSYRRRPFPFTTPSPLRYT